MGCFFAVDRFSAVITVCNYIMGVFLFFKQDILLSSLFFLEIVQAESSALEGRIEQEMAIK